MAAFGAFSEHPVAVSCGDTFVHAARACSEAADDALSARAHVIAAEFQASALRSISWATAFRAGCRLEAATEASRRADAFLEVNEHGHANMWDKRAIALRREARDDRQLEMQLIERAGVATKDAMAARADAKAAEYAAASTKNTATVARAALLEYGRTIVAHVKRLQHGGLDAHRIALASEEVFRAAVSSAVAAFVPPSGSFVDTPTPHLAESVVHAALGSASLDEYVKAIRALACEEELRRHHLLQLTADVAEWLEVSQTAARAHADSANALRRNSIACCF